MKRRKVYGFLCFFVACCCIQWYFFHYSSSLSVASSKPKQRGKASFDLFNPDAWPVDDGVVTSVRKPQQQQQQQQREEKQQQQGVQEGSLERRNNVQQEDRTDNSNNGNSIKEDEFDESDLEKSEEGGNNDNDNDDDNDDDSPLMFIEPRKLDGNGDSYVDAVAAQLGQSCRDACSQQGFECADDVFLANVEMVNHCKAMTYLFGCPRGCVEDAPGPDQPAFFPMQEGSTEASKHKHRGVCLIHGNPRGSFVPNCVASYPMTQRACVCKGTGNVPPRKPPAVVARTASRGPRPVPAVHPYGNNDRNRAAQVYIAVHASLNKMRNIALIAIRFQGPVKAAIYVEHPETEDTSKIKIPKNVEVKFVNRRADDAAYPVNDLRQVALDMVPKGDHDYVFAIDVDFIPSRGLHDQIMYWMPWIEEHKEDSVFVVPAFEAKKKQVPPATLQDLDECRDNRKCFFVLELQHPVAHEAVDYPKWDMADSPYEVVYAWTFEPYILGLRKCLPDYPLQFRYYGNDKIAWIYQIAQWGARFYVLPRGFITHKWHPHNPWRTQERDSKKAQVENMFMDFAKHGSKQVPRPPQCHGAVQNGLLA